MSFEYTDPNGDTINILPGIDDGNVWVEVGHHETGWVMSVAHEDAPAAALAILEAAGVDPDNAFGVDIYAADACGLLQAWKRKTEQKRAEQAKRESEDAKVRGFRESSLSAFASVFSDSNYDSTGWEGLSETGREGWRARYRAARKFFEES